MTGHRPDQNELLVNLGFSSRAIRALMGKGVVTLRDLLSCSKHMLKAAHGLGDKGIEHTEARVWQLGYTLPRDHELCDKLIIGDTMIVGYCGKTGLVFPEEVVQENIDRLLASQRYFTVGGTNEVTYLRVLVKRGKIGRLVFKDKGSGTDIPIDSDGNIPACPQHFADGHTKWLMELF